MTDPKRLVIGGQPDVQTGGVAVTPDGQFLAVTGHDDVIDKFTLRIYQSGVRIFYSEFAEAGMLARITDDGSAVAVLSTTTLYIFHGPGYASLTQPTSFTGSPVSLAMSGDGETIVLGDATANKITVLEGFPTYPTANEIQPAVLDGGDYFGWAVAISQDGTTVVAGSPHFGSILEGRAFVFTGPWSAPTETELLTDVTTDRAGVDVDVSGDGSVVVMGAPFAPVSFPGEGEAYIKYNDGTPYGGEIKLVSPHPGVFTNFGLGVRVTADGTQVVVAAPYAAFSIAAGEVYTYDGALWGTQTLLDNSFAAGETVGVGYGGNSGSGLSAPAPGIIAAAVYIGGSLTPPPAYVWGVGYDFDPPEPVPPPVVTGVLSIDGNALTYSPTEIELRSAEAVESELVSGARQATPRDHAVELRLTYGVDVAITEVMDELRGARGSTIYHYFEFADPSGTNHTVYVNWPALPPFVASLEFLYKRFTIVLRGTV